jgi:hypothetical protein
MDPSAFFALLILLIFFIIGVGAAISNAALKRRRPNSNPDPPTPPDKINQNPPKQIVDQPEVTPRPPVPAEPRSSPTDKPEAKPPPEPVPPPKEPPTYEDATKVPPARNPDELVAPERDSDVPEPATARAAATGVAGIFVSYRRQDEPNFAGRLYDRLVTRFGRSNVFIDVDTIELGLDFAEVIDESLLRCKAMIVIIGKNWLSATDEEGDLRLNNPDDYVRLEIERALSSKTRVIPVLVEGAAVPKSSQLPKPLHSLGRRNGIAMSHASFGSDADRLIETLDRILKATPM